MQAAHTPLPWTLVGNEIRKVWGSALGHVVIATFGEAGNAEDEANAKLAFDALAATQAPAVPRMNESTGEWSRVPTEILDRFPEINPSNYDHDDACAVNAWGVELVLAAETLAPALTPIAGNTEDARSMGAVSEMIAKHAALLEDNPYCYFELAYTRSTEWMAWICSKPSIDDPGRKIIAKGQGSTPDGACRAALTQAASTGGAAS